MIDQSTINILVVISIIILYALQFTPSVKISEHLTANTASSNESLQNIASVYNTGTLVVDNLQVKNNLQVGKNLQVSGTSTLGQWNIRNDRIGIPSRGDINLADDQWTRLYNYDQSSYTSKGGFAGQNLWCGGGDLTCSSLTSRSASASENMLLAGGNVLTDNMAVGIQSSRGGYLADKGGWTSCNPKKQTNWETMRITKLPVPVNPLKVYSGDC